MGAAAHTSRGLIRFVLSAIGAAPALYATVVLFGVGPSFPSALGRYSVPAPQAVHFQAPGPAGRAPARRPSQAPAEPARQHPRVRRGGPAPARAARTRPHIARAPVPSEPARKPAPHSDSITAAALGAPQPSAQPAPAAAPVDTAALPPVSVPTQPVGLPPAELPPAPELPVALP